MDPGFQEVRRICQQAVDDAIVPGLVLLAAAGGRTVFHDAFGWRQVTPQRLPAQPDTVYDVASLTKAVVTSVAVMQLVERGALALDDRVAARLPELAGPGKDAITVRHLLAHASGLPAHRPFWQTAAAAASGRFAIPRLAAGEPLVDPVGAQSVYSDLGFIILGRLVEQIGGLRLDVHAERAIFAPLGLRSATFVNLGEEDDGARARLLSAHTVAATQERAGRGVVVGEVDDLNAQAMGGVAGHAGLFADAGDLATLAGALVAAWKRKRSGGNPEGAAGPIIGGDRVRELWAPAGVPGSTWRLGWDGPAPSGSQAGSRLSRAAVGHLGFTGCSIWIDPERELWVILLSNRVHPTVPTDDRFRRWRPRVHDAVLEALGVPPDA
jgi:CubicO group peptidase (beta-lactamase class C family)